ncbi:hypothetical protein N7465_007628 [Penicillium sp. CMV-2018d]|nr:hypothetical protein N7465_007628 [Penicillium sp. CMV-2018d]
MDGLQKTPSPRCLALRRRTSPATRLTRTKHSSSPSVDSTISPRYTRCAGTRPTWLTRSTDNATARDQARPPRTNIDDGRRDDRQRRDSRGRYHTAYLGNPPDEPEAFMSYGVDGDDYRT